MWKRTDHFAPCGHTYVLSGNGRGIQYLKCPVCTVGEFTHSLIETDEKVAYHDTESVQHNFNPDGIIWTSVPFSTQGNHPFGESLLHATIPQPQASPNTSVYQVSTATISDGDFWRAWRGSGSVESIPATPSTRSSTQDTEFPNGHTSQAEYDACPICHPEREDDSAYDSVIAEDESEDPEEPQ